MIYLLGFIIIWSTQAFSAPPECATSSSNPPSYEQIDHSHCLVNDISLLYPNSEFMDVELDVDNKKLRAHRTVLASRSSYFRGLFYGGYEESQKSKVKINGISVTSFKVLLEYIYTGRMNLNDLKDEVILELFDVSDMFGFPILKPPLSKYLLSNVNVHNACSLFAAARLHQHKELVDESITFIDNHASDVLQSDGFVFLSTEALQEILIRDSFYANELDIFRAVCRWINENEKYLDSDTKMKVLSTVRYPLMSDEELLEVRETQLVRSDTISDAIQFRNTSLPHNLPFRGQLKPNQNLLDSSQGARVIKDINGDDMIMLGHPSIINYIRMLYDEYLGSLGYYVEVSIDGHGWVRVIDYSDYICRSLQHLWIHPRVARYIRMSSPKNTIQQTSKLFEVTYNTKKRHLLEIENEIVSPKYNVALKSLNATLIKGKTGFNNKSLLDGYSKDYVRYNTYTWHRLGSGCILVQLPQPYMLSSMRMLLWDRDNRAYKYTVEISVDKRHWKVIVDKSKESARSWQELQFRPSPVVFIRITGVYSSAGDDFRCVYLEAPAQETLDTNIIEDHRAE